MMVQTQIDRAQAAINNVYGHQPDWQVIGVGNDILILTNGIITVCFNWFTGALTDFEWSFI